MSQNSEQIEAKLCAYLEGELDESGRAEIEKHLQQNPAHRKLLAEVGKTRDLLRALPREPAPPDICEAFQGQLERSVLLADLDDEGATASLKINRWRQYLAVAAVVTLAAGLGLVVYFGLPGPSDRNFAGGGAGGGGPPGTGGATEDGAVSRSMSAAPEPPTTAGKPTEGVESVAQVDADAQGQLSKKTSDAAAGAVRGPVASAPAAQPGEQLDVLARRLQGSWETKERERLFTSASAGDAAGTLRLLRDADVDASAMCYVVTSPQPGVEAERIGQELSKLQVAWEYVPRPDAAAVDQLKSDASATPAEGPVAADTRDTQTNVLAERTEGDTPSRDRAGGRPTDSVALRGAAAVPEPGASARLNDESAAGLKATSPSGGAQPAPARPSDEFAAAPQSQDKMKDAAAAPAPAPTSASAAGGYALGIDPSSRPETLIVARGLTRQQAESLRTSLGGNEQQARVFTANLQTLTSAAVADAPVRLEQATASNNPTLPAPAAPTSAVPSPAVTAPATDGVIRQGDALRVVIGREPGEQSVSEVQVGSDGSVRVPGLGVFQCAGLTVTQFREQLAAGPQPGAAGGEAKRLEVARVEKAESTTGVAAGEPDAIAMATEAEVAQRAARYARGDAGSRGRAARPAPALAPAPAAEPSAPAGATPAPAPHAAEARGGGGGSSADAGGAPGAAGRSPVRELQVRRGAPDTNATTQFAQVPGQSPATQPVAAPVTTLGAVVDHPDERVDVVIVVRADAPDARAAGQSPAVQAGVPVEPAGPIARHEILVIQFGDTEADSANVRVAEDGTVELPRIGRVEAEGLTAEDLGRRIAAKLRGDAADAPPANVVVKRLGAGFEGAAAAPEGAGQQPPATGETPAANEPPSDPSAPQQVDIAPAPSKDPPRE